MEGLRKADVQSFVPFGVFISILGPLGAMSAVVGVAVVGWMFGEKTRAE